MFINPMKNTGKDQANILNRVVREEATFKPRREL